MKAYKLVLGVVEPQEMFNSVTYFDIRYFTQKSVGNKVFFELNNFLQKRKNDFKTRNYLKRYLELYEKCSNEHELYKYKKEQLEMLELADKVSVYLEFTKNWPENTKGLLLYLFTCSSRFLKLEEFEIEE